MKSKDKAFENDLRKLLDQSEQIIDEWKREAFTAITIVTIFKQHRISLIDWIKRAAPMLDHSLIKESLDLTKEGYFLVELIEKTDEIIKETYGTTTKTREEKSPTNLS